MKKTLKALILCLCAVLLVVASIMGTMAYLTSNDTVKNTFTVGNVAITLDEADVKTDGTYETDATARVDTNEYKLLPGHTYIKDPTIHVDANSEDCWLFVKVENGISDIEDTASTIANQMAADWTLVSGEANVYAYKSTVSKSADVKVFDNFKIKGDVDNTALAAYAEKTIVVTAYAVQADGFNTAAEAWTTNKSSFSAP